MGRLDGSDSMVVNNAVQAVSSGPNCSEYGQATKTLQTCTQLHDCMSIA